MVRREAECKVDHKEHMREGDGTVILTSLISSPKELYDKGRLFSRITLNPGCSIGYHVHEGESELFYFMRGEGVYNDNGTEVKVSPGDVAICPAGEGHGIANRGDEVLELVAVIVYA